MYPNPRTKPRSANRSRPRANLNSLVTQKVNEHIKGKSFKPSPSPPVFQLQPWNDAIIRDKLKINQTELTYSITKLAMNLVKQIGLYTQHEQVYNSCGVEFQIQSITAWNISEVSGGFIRLLPIDFTNSTDQSHELATPASNAAKNQYAAVGYVFPSAHQQHVHYFPPTTLKNYDDDQLGNLCIIDVNGNSDVELHVKVKWRSAYGSNIALDYVTVLQNSRLISVPQEMIKVIERINSLNIDKAVEEVFHEASSEGDFEAVPEKEPNVLVDATKRSKSLISRMISSYVSKPDT